MCAKWRHTCVSVTGLLLAFFIPHVVVLGAVITRKLAVLVASPVTGQENVSSSEDIVVDGLGIHHHIGLPIHEIGMVGSGKIGHRGLARSVLNTACRECKRIVGEQNSGIKPVKGIVIIKCRVNLIVHDFNDSGTPNLNGGGLADIINCDGCFDGLPYSDVSTNVRCEFDPSPLVGLHVRQLLTVDKGLNGANNCENDSESCNY